MKIQDNSRLGSYISRSTAGESYQCFIPSKLPPTPALDMNFLYKPLDQAMIALGGINQRYTDVPDIQLFIYMYVRKEALVSSQIEGTQSSFSDLLLFENQEKTSVPIEDVEEVSNYIAAINYGFERMREGFPFSVRLICEMHGILLRGGRGSNKSPGAFRKSQNWIGGISPSKAMFVPPPPEVVENLMSDLEKFIHDENQNLPALIKAAFIHFQFETIHPFLDGNGRLGRLLIVMLLYKYELLEYPILYLSLYFKEHRQLYYDLLQDVRIKGNFERWCEFFLDGVTITAKQMADDAKKIFHLFEKDRAQISKIGRASSTALKVHNYALKHPYLYSSTASKELGIPIKTIINTLVKLEEIGILEKTNGQMRNRLFAYTEYLEILATGTEPLR